MTESQLAYFMRQNEFILLIRIAFGLLDADWTIEKVLFVDFSVIMCEVLVARLLRRLHVSILASIRHHSLVRQVRLEQ